MWSKVSSIEYMFLESMNGSEAFRAVPDGRPFRAMTSRSNVVVFFGKRSEPIRRLYCKKCGVLFRKSSPPFLLLDCHGCCSMPKTRRAGYTGYGQSSPTFPPHFLLQVRMPQTLSKLSMVHFDCLDVEEASFASKIDLRSGLTACGGKSGIHSDVPIQRIGVPQKLSDLPAYMTKLHFRSHLLQADRTAQVALVRCQPMYAFELLFAFH
jgi:hypothetical protein